MIHWWFTDALPLHWETHLWVWCDLCCFLMDSVAICCSLLEVATLYTINLSTLFVKIHATPDICNLLVHKMYIFFHHNVYFFTKNVFSLTLKSTDMTEAPETIRIRTKMNHNLSIFEKVVQWTASTVAPQQKDAAKGTCSISLPLCRLWFLILRFRWNKFITS